LIGTAGAAAVESDRRAAFAQLVGRDLDRAYRIAGVILGNSSDAEDATHDAIVQAWRSYGRLRDAARFEAWFQRILVNVCRDRLRKRRRSPVTELTIAGGVTMADRFADIDDRLALDRAFERLTADQAITLALRYYADLTLEAVADRMHVPVGTVKSRLHTALAVMQQAMSGAEMVER
jgi:RNA polymerase sigma factor (sigma-70 family)